MSRDTRRPMRESSPIPASVQVWDLEKNKVIREHDVDNIKACRDWLHRQNVWAMAQGYGIQIVPREVQ